MYLYPAMPFQASQAGLLYNQTFRANLLWKRRFMSSQPSLLVVEECNVVHRPKQPRPTAAHLDDGTIAYNLYTARPVQSQQCGAVVGQSKGNTITKLVMLNISSGIHSILHAILIRITTYKQMQLTLHAWFIVNSSQKVTSNIMSNS